MSKSSHRVGARLCSPANGGDRNRSASRRSVRERSESEPHSDIEQHLRRRRLEHDGRSGGPHDHFLDRSEAAATAVIPPPIVDDLSGPNRLDADDLEAMQEKHVATDHDCLGGRHLLLGLPGRKPARCRMALSLREHGRDRAQHEKRGDG